jgi:TPR repeat protein
MASLTPLSKGLIALAVIGGMASAVWHLGLKDKFSGLAAQQVQPDTTTSDAPASSMVVPADINAAPAAVANTGSTSKLSVAENAETGRKLMDRGNFAQARTHLQAAVQGGDGPSACHLGEMTLNGQGGIAASQEQAAKLFQLAQSRGSICFALGQ